MIDIPRSSSGRTALEVAQEAARIAGRIALENFTRAKRIAFKGRNNVVTDVDVMAEKETLRLIREEYPNFSVMSEESEAVVTDSPFTWVVDPLDGTRNYASSVPHFCVVTALAYHGRIVVGVTYDPVRDEMFYAEKGKGAFLNGERIHVSSRASLDDSLVGMDLGYIDRMAVVGLKMIQGLWDHMQGLRIMGSSALGLAYTAAGRFDIYLHHSLYPWDIASGLLLVEEAGGVVVDRHGNPATLESRSVIASNPHLVEAFLKATEGTDWRSMPEG